MEKIEWLNQRTALINGGGRVEFAGLIRGANFPVVRYYAPTVDEAVDGLVLDEWIYVVRVDSETVMSSARRKEVFQ